MAFFCFGFCLLWSKFTVVSWSDDDHGLFWHEESSQAVFLHVQKACREETSQSNLLLQSVAGKLLYKAFPKKSWTQKAGVSYWIDCAKVLGAGTVRSSRSGMQCWSATVKWPSSYNQVQLALETRHDILVLWCDTTCSGGRSWSRAWLKEAHLSGRWVWYSWLMVVVSFASVFSRSAKHITMMVLKIPASSVAHGTQKLP